MEKKRRTFRKSVAAVLAATKLRSSSNHAVSTSNAPGELLDVHDNSLAAKAADAVRQNLQGDETSLPVIVHEEENFARLRHIFGRSEEEFKHALCASELRLVSEAEAAGKSNSFFVFTGDGRYCLKYLEAWEARELLRVLSSYVEYVGKHPGTVLPKFYALYEIRMGFTRKSLWLVVTGNVIGGRHAVIRRFDLKGSSHGRKASARERAKGERSVLKDLDFVRGGCSIRGANPEAEETWKMCVDAMEQDSAWLASQNLLDYSLILGYAWCDLQDLKAPLSHVIRLQVKHTCLGSECLELNSDGRALVLYAGVVDCLMRYTWFKRLENLVLDAFVSGDISCQPPAKYATRFADFVRRLHLPPKDLEEYFTARERAASRPLGRFINEYGRKDLKALAVHPATILLSGGLAAGLLFWSGHFRKKGGR